MKREEQDNKNIILVSYTHFLDSFFEKTVLLAENLVQNYTPKIYLGRVLFFKARDSFFISYKLESPEVNLQKLVMGSLEIYEIPGNHDSMLRESNLKLLAEKLASHLAKNSPELETVTEQEQSFYTSFVSLSGGKAKVIPQID